ncbi:hypothetical protein [Allorhizobium taibaishanense]|uniref:Zinc/iron-chelating domain-containing protein n=1 Tax=Allorhizobium taibaishanense TaxID=887144 RepID=A0A1Q9A484_9HYPH|nr:hypothetical protein [Allorhizobium taibaishanense]MBB4006379.1 hypothetical protein [Allorhizobium taibaishanense]OLP49328.1 hypothetical protein BJF91_19960 [Allorhizobium taibaishanense]
MPIPVSQPIAGPARRCGTCTLCCRLPDIEELDKPANQPCRHCNQTGCRIYEARPQLCRDFLCLWMEGHIGPEWHPQDSHMMVYGQGAQVTVLVDPAFPDVWQRPPYSDQMRRWASQAEPKGGYVIVFIGDTVVKISPQM